MTSERPLTDKQRAMVAYVHASGPCLLADIASHIKDTTAVVRAGIKPLVTKGYLAKRMIFGIAEPTLGMGRGHLQKLVEVRAGKRKLED